MPTSTTEELPKNSIEAILAKAKKKGIKSNTRYSKSSEKTPEKADQKIELIDEVKSIISEPDTSLEVPESIPPIVEIEMAKSETAESAIDETEVAEKVTATSEIAKNVVATSETVKKATTTNSLEVVYLMCEEVLNYTVDDTKLLSHILKRTEYGRLESVLIRREEFLMEGKINKRKLSDSIKNLEGKGVISRKLKMEKNLKCWLYTIEEEFIKKFIRV